MTRPVNPFHRAVYLTGPTASGKSEAGLELAVRLNAEILALDSMTLYRGMDIGTAKPGEEELCAVPHHLIDVLDPWDSASVADYRGWAASAIADIEARGKRVLFVGGTPLYLKACLRGLFEGPPAALEIRKRLEEEAQRLGHAHLHQQLANLDPPTAERLHENDVRRVIRALEVFETTGRRLSDLQVEHDQPAPSSVAVFALDRPVENLNQRINLRVERMFADGLVEEVRRLRSMERPWNVVPAAGVGYREVAEMLNGRRSEAETIEATQLRTRQFAKRQRTWFRGLREVRAISVGTGETGSSMATRLFEAIQEKEDDRPEINDRASSRGGSPEGSR